METTDADWTDPHLTSRYVKRLLVLAAVPLLTALLNVGDLLAMVRERHLSIAASFPVYRYDLWSFIDPPQQDGLYVAVPVVGPESLAWVIPLLIGYIVLSGILSAGYFGSIAEGITTGSFDFVANVRRFAPRMIVLEAIMLLVVVAIFVPLLVFPPLFIVMILAMLIVAYFLFPTVYVMVLEERDIESSARRAHQLVVDDGPAAFFLTLVGATILCSIPLSLMASSGVGGALMAAGIAAVLGLTFNVATMLKVESMATL